ncbi:hypothetical protein [Oceanobacter mangrovi]|uniref:hypothetical protein n=1 Tax=Oceanobacter mangrovi TaxID=2862510 RepID=UPI001C8E743F|nr:hypothetical protein [Oceanobacter mangrovi]
MSRTITNARAEELLASLLARLQSLPVDTLAPQSLGLSNDCYTDILRLDQLHPVLQGNKFFKLLVHWPDLLQADGWVTPGGVWSNHLHAVAWLAQQLEISATGLIRGYAAQPLTAMLADCQRWGMQLQFLDRKAYQQRYDAVWQRQQAQNFHGYFIGEGGALAAFSQGSANSCAASFCDQAEQAFDWLIRQAAGYDQICLAIGSGTLAEHLLPRLPAAVRLLGVQVVADQGALQQGWQQQFSGYNWRLLSSAASFGKQRQQLLPLIQQWDQQQLPLEPIYTAPMLAAVTLHKAEFEGRKTLFLHGGGLQGRRGIGLDYVFGDSA